MSVEIPVHPILPAGYNSSPIGWDDINSPGVTQASNVDLFDSGNVGRPLVQDEILWADPDLRIRRERRHARVQREPRRAKVKEF